MPKMSMDLGSNCCSLFFDRVLKVFQHQNILKFLSAFLFIVAVYCRIEKSQVLGGYLKRFTIHVFFFISNDLLASLRVVFLLSSDNLFRNGSLLQKLNALKIQLRCVRLPSVSEL